MVQPVIFVIQLGLGALLFFGLPAMGEDNSSIPGPKPTNTGKAAEYLEFLSIQDGHCHNLSEGGQLCLLKNNHPTKKIKFRLERYFVGVRQPGLVVGVIGPGGEPVRLGCTRVDGREQDWKVRLATFAD